MSETVLEQQGKTTGTMTGAWSEYSCQISKEAEAAFKSAMNGFVGVNYTPVAFAQQVVAGMNYSFFCNAKVVYPNAPNEAAIVNIYQPLNGPAHITQIQRINQ